MQRLALTIALIAAFGTAAFAHQGSLGLYTDQNANDCDRTFVAFASTELYLMYYRSDAGPNGIFAAEFKLEFDDDIVLFSGITVPPGAGTLGTLDNGMAIALNPCQGLGATYAWVATLTAVAFDVSAPFTIRVGQSNTVTRPALAGHPQVAMCDETRTIVGVLGGYFTHPDGTCSTGTEASSWGAIKELYRR